MTAAARAEYIISARDQTRQALDSVKRGFGGLESTMQSVRKTMSFLGKGAAAAMLVQGFRGAMSAGSELQETVDRLGYSLTNEQKAAVERADKAWTALGRSFESSRVSILTALGPAVEWLAKMIGIAIPKAVEIGRKAFEVLRFTILAVAEKAVAGLSWFYDVLGKLPGSIGQTYRDAAASMGALAEKIQVMRDGYLAASTPLESFTVGLQRQSQVMGGYLKKMNAQTQLEMERGFEWIEEMQKRSNRDPYQRSGINPQTQLEMERNFEWIEEQAKGAAKGMSVYWDEAARNMQDSFADFLFDPFQDGIRGMLRGFVDTLRRMAAEAAAASIFEKLFGKKESGGGLSGILGSFFGGMFGGAKAGGGSVSAGKVYRVNENGTEYFKPAGDGQVIPIGGGGGGGQGTVVHVEIHNDNRGASADFQKVAPALFKQQAEQIEAKIIEGLRRKRYAGV